MRAYVCTDFLPLRYPDIAPCCVRCQCCGFLRGLEPGRAQGRLLRRQWYTCHLAVRSCECMVTVKVPLHGVADVWRCRCTRVCAHRETARQWTVFAEDATRRQALARRAVSVALSGWQDARPSPTSCWVCARTAVAEGRLQRTLPTLKVRGSARGGSPGLYRPHKLVQVRSKQRRLLQRKEVPTRGRRGVRHNVRETAAQARKGAPTQCARMGRSEKKPHMRTHTVSARNGTRNLMDVHARGAALQRVGGVCVCGAGRGGFDGATDRDCAIANGVRTASKGASRRPTGTVTCAPLAKRTTGPRLAPLLPQPALSPCATWRLTEPVTGTVEWSGGARGCTSSRRATRAGKWGNVLARTHSRTQRGTTREAGAATSPIDGACTPPATTTAQSYLGKHRGPHTCTGEALLVKPQARCGGAAQPVKVEVGDQHAQGQATPQLARAVTPLMELQHTQAYTYTRTSAHEHTHTAGTRIGAKLRSELPRFHHTRPRVRDLFQHPGRQRHGTFIQCNTKGVRLGGLGVHVPSDGLFRTRARTGRKGGWV